ncbi:insecticidal delta-endotoxin Cry8Ea1 family protein [Brevibacillus halotolerans]|uniref:insecticidal delta-endotoxin Cry8Ea1 family protein n=1 Tax=Brevibacillus TaxID=55080 RepID=UPI00215BC224|nr:MULTISPECIES: insecticidal delta-endotoxin Cry8Ea1 family protein [Brevibacillus]MCR8964201.1 insecticidal delta-endotoxin Cry8Ea1 family protein [Brevibacillus laterosporus]MCZ0836356.1 insecticidal delta-endotoxin Cry8Ea1 family protein [Brevibacillus halotolerans]
MNNNFNGNGLTPINNNVISGDLVTNDCTPCHGFIPINVLRKDPFRRMTIQELTNEWTEWKENSPSLFTPAIVGIVTGFLLEALKKEAKARLLQFLHNLLFPGSSTLTMEEILRATEQFVKQQLDTTTWNRVSGELEGLENNIRTFNDQVDDFLQNRIGIEPTAIIDSVNTMQQLFVNRMPQFKIRGYEVLLLPLYAQAATLHLTFIRDVIIHADDWNIPSAQLNTYKGYLKRYVAEHSNYCLTTYDTEFKARFYPRATLRNMVEFKTFMTLNVLDFVSIWSLLKYENLFISTSANLYNIGNNTVNEGSYTISYWPFFNSYIQANSNYVLSGISGFAWRWFYRNPIWGEYYQDSLYYIRTSYVGGIQGPQIGSPLSATELEDQIEQEARADIPTGFTDISFNCTLRNPIGVPYYATRFNEFRNGALGSGFGRSDNYRSNDSTCGLGTGFIGDWVYYPDYYITNISATVQDDGTSPNTTPLYFGQNRPITSDRGVDKGIAIYNRKSNIAGTAQNGTIIHQAPNDGTGFTISPLHPTSISAPGIAHIQENYGNSGDSLRITGTAIIFYTLSGNGQDRYRLYLRLSGGGSILTNVDNGPSGYVVSFNTGTDNEGVTDNGSKFKDFALGSTSFVLNAESRLKLQVTATSSSPIDVMNIILLSENETPLY